MKGHGSFQITLAGGEIFDAPNVNDTFEVNGGIITAKIVTGGRGEDEYHVIKLWQKLMVPVGNVDG